MVSIQKHRERLRFKKAKERSPHETRESYLFCSLLHPQPPEQCLAQSNYFVNLCLINNESQDLKAQGKVKDEQPKHRCHSEEPRSQRTF